MPERSVDRIRLSAADQRAWAGAAELRDLLATGLNRARAKGGDWYHGDKIAAALREDPTFKSVYGGSMEFQANGVAKKRVALFKVENGDKVFEKYIEAK